MPENSTPPEKEGTAFEELCKIRPYSFKGYGPDPISNARGIKDDSSEALFDKTANAFALIKRITQIMPGGEGGYPPFDPQTFRKYTREELEKKFESSYQRVVFMSHASLVMFDLQEEISKNLEILKQRILAAEQAHLVAEQTQARRPGRPPRGDADSSRSR